MADARGIYGPVAGLYDEVRPGYPEALIEDVIRLSGIRPDGLILEVGCGPGKATVMLARHGLRIVAVDPVPEMLEVARRRCAPFTSVEFREDRFEDLPVADCSVDLVVAAQSFHWIRPDVGYRKAGRILRPGGALALIWNHEVQADDDLERALGAVYQGIAPAARAAMGEAGRWSDPERIDATGLFGPVETRLYRRATRYDAATFIKLLNTRADHRAMSEEIRRALAEEVRRTIKAHGGFLSRAVESVLYLARRCAPRSG